VSLAVSAEDTHGEDPDRAGSFRSFRKGSFNYLAASVGHSLYRNGAVLTRRDSDGSDADFAGVVIDTREMPVRDARLLESRARCSVAANGFELLERPLGKTDLDFLKHEDVVRRYYDQCSEIVRDATGASQVYAFDHNVRSAQGKQSRERITGGQQVQAPAHVVHGDYTLTSAPQRLRELALPPSANDTLRPFLEAGRSLVDQRSVDRALEPQGRFAIINVWRNITDDPVATHPLALCDAQTVHPEDLVVFEIHYSDRVGENYFAKHAPRHRWYCYPALTRDEALLIKQWDSAGSLARSEGKQTDASQPEAPCTFSFHSAFVDPGAPPDAPDRWSIEVRCAVVYD
jgi:hypothetical protein